MVKSLLTGILTSTILVATEATNGNTSAAFAQCSNYQVRANGGHNQCYSRTETRMVAISPGTQDIYQQQQEPEHDDPKPHKEQEELPKFSESVPFLTRPKELKLEMAGDVGFDPLNFAKNRDLLYEYREAEIKHARLAMLAAAGWPVSELLDRPIASLLKLDPLVDGYDRAPSMFNGGMDKVPVVWWGFCLGMTAAIDLYGVNRARVAMAEGDDSYMPGDLGFDPMGLYPVEEDGRKRMQLAEIKHGRLAMIAVLAFSVQEFVTGIGVVDETPFFFKPIIATARPVLESIASGN